MNSKKIVYNTRSVTRNQALFACDSAVLPGPNTCTHDGVGGGRSKDKEEDHDAVPAVATHPNATVVSQMQSSEVVSVSGSLKGTCWSILGSLPVGSILEDVFSSSSEDLNSNTGGGKAVSVVTSDEEDKSKEGEKHDQDDVDDEDDVDLISFQGSDISARKVHAEINHLCSYSTYQCFFCNISLFS